MLTFFFILFIFLNSVSGDSRVLHAALLQLGVHQVQVHGGHVEVHIHVDGHLLGALGAPEVDLQATPGSNSSRLSLTVSVQRVPTYLDVLGQLLDESHMLSERGLQAEDLVAA